MLLDFAAPTDAVEQRVVFVVVLHPLVEQLHGEEHRLLGAQPVLTGGDVLVHAQHQGDHILGGVAVEARGHRLADQGRRRLQDLVRRVLDVRHLGAEHRVRPLEVAAGGEAEDVDHRIDDLAGRTAGLLGALGLRPGRHARQTEQGEVVGGVEDRRRVEGLQVGQRVVGVAIQPTPADAAGDVAVVALVVLEVVRVDVAEIHAGVRLARPASAVDVQLGADVFLAVPTGAHEHLQAAVQLRHVDVHLGDDVGLAQFLVGRLEEAAPGVVEAVHQVVGGEEVGLAPGDLLLAEAELQALADREVDVQLADLLVVVEIHDVALTIGLAIVVGAHLLEVLEEVGLHLAGGAQLGDHRHVLGGLPLQVEARGAACHRQLALVVVAGGVLPVLRVPGHFLAQVAVDLEAVFGEGRGGRGGQGDRQGELVQRGARARAHHAVLVHVLSPEWLAARNRWFLVVVIPSQAG
ncbi:hypothetical protein D3C80_972230 [compost metagenome]